MHCWTCNLVVDDLDEGVRCNEVVQVLNVHISWKSSIRWRRKCDCGVSNQILLVCNKSLVLNCDLSRSRAINAHYFKSYGRIGQARERFNGFNLKVVHLDAKTVTRVDHYSALVVSKPRRQRSANRDANILN